MIEVSAFVTRPTMPLDVIGKGLVSTSDRPYQSGTSKHWIKFKNRKHHARRRPAAARDAELKPILEAMRDQTYREIARR